MIRIGMWYRENLMKLIGNSDSEYFAINFDYLIFASRIMTNSVNSSNGKWFIFFFNATFVFDLIFIHLYK